MNATAEPARMSLRCCVLSSVSSDQSRSATTHRASGGQAHLESAFNTIRSSGGRNLVMRPYEILIVLVRVVLGVDTLTLWQRLWGLRACLKRLMPERGD